LRSLVAFRACSGPALTMLRRCRVAWLGWQPWVMASVTSSVEDAGAAASDDGLHGLLFRQAPWWRWWLHLLVIWEARGVAVGGSRLLRQCLDLVALVAVMIGTPPGGTSGCSSGRFTLGAGAGGVCGCQFLHEDVVLDLGLVPGLRVKTLVCLLGLVSGDTSRRHPPEGVVVEPRHRRSGLGEVLG
jgi:hypothetical protein